MKESELVATALNVSSPTLSKQGLTESQGPWKTLIRQSDVSGARTPLDEVDEPLSSPH